MTSKACAPVHTFIVSNAPTAKCRSLHISPRGTQWERRVNANHITEPRTDRFWVNTRESSTTFQECTTKPFATPRNMKDTKYRAGACHHQHWLTNGPAISGIASLTKSIRKLRNTIQCGMHTTPRNNGKPRRGRIPENAYHADSSSRGK